MGGCGIQEAYHKYEDPDQRLEGYRVVCFLQVLLNALELRDHLHPFARSLRTFLQGLNYGATEFFIGVI